LVEIVMERWGSKKQEVWEPLAKLVNQGLGPINDDIKRQKPTARPKASFTAEELGRKFGDWHRAFTAAKNGLKFWHKGGSRRDRAPCRY
jgi:hypothetical protein